MQDQANAQNAKITQNLQRFKEAGANVEKDNEEVMTQDEILKTTQSDAHARNPWVGEEKPKKDIPKVQKGLSWMDQLKQKPNRNQEAPQAKAGLNTFAPFLTQAQTPAIRATQDSDTALQEPTPLDLIKRRFNWD